MKLNARQIDFAKPKEKAYKLADGAGLYLEIFPSGSKRKARCVRALSRHISCGGEE
ncbi:hypothetical protein GCM10009414_24210 [Tatumella terrea]